jgi:basic membrane protein A
MIARFFSRRFLSPLLQAAAVFVLLLGVSELGPAPAQAAPKKWRVALVLPGMISDRGFNANGYAGLMLAKEKYGVETAFSENTPMANYERVIRGFADDGNQIIFMNGLEFTDLARKIAPDYPKQYFIVMDGSGLGGPNMASIRGKSEDAAFLCGILAGLTTKTNKIGAIIGFDYPLLVAQVEALRLGARSSNPQATVTVTYLGTFDDPSKGKEAALAQIGAGVDVLYHIADNAGLGVIQAAQEKGVKVIGWGRDQNAIAPQTIISSEVIDTPKLMADMVKTIMDGHFSGQPVVAGFDVGGVGLADYRGLVPAATAAEVARWKQAFVENRLHIAYTVQRDGAVNAPAVTLPP